MSNLLGQETSIIRSVVIKINGDNAINALISIDINNIRYMLHSS